MARRSVSGLGVVTTPRNYVKVVCVLSVCVSCPARSLDNPTKHRAYTDWGIAAQQTTAAEMWFPIVMGLAKFGYDPNPGLRTHALVILHRHAPTPDPHGFPSPFHCGTPTRTPCHSWHHREYTSLPVINRTFCIVALYMGRGCSHCWYICENVEHCSFVPSAASPVGLQRSLNEHNSPVQPR